MSRTASQPDTLWDFDGRTYEPAHDRVRLNRQLQQVLDAMRDGAWRTLSEIEAATGAPQASVSARLRDLRKERFGAHDVQRRRRGGVGGTWEYSVKRKGAM